jgi:hypothetical protein
MLSRLVRMAADGMATEARVFLGFGIPIDQCKPFV